MSKILPHTIYQSGNTADPYQLQRELTRAAEVVNGDISCLELGDGIATAATMADNCCNDYYINSDPFRGTLTLQVGDVTGRDWNYPAGGMIDFASDEGMIIGYATFDTRNFGQTVTDVTYGWSIGIFVDGHLAGAIDRQTVQGYGVSIPFALALTKGSHRLSIGIKTYAYTASSATNPDDVISLYTPFISWRIAKR